MVSVNAFKKSALSLPETDEHPHFHLISFRVEKKIFAALDTEKKKLMAKLSFLDQSVFRSSDKSIIYLVPGGWGKKEQLILS